jgi:hypothetical protein
MVFLLTTLLKMDLLCTWFHSRFHCSFISFSSSCFLKKEHRPINKHKEGTYCDCALSIKGKKQGRKLLKRIKGHNYTSSQSAPAMCLYIFLSLTSFDSLFADEQTDQVHLRGQHQNLCLAKNEKNL